MKKSKAETARTRRRIIEIASKAFRARGIEATCLVEIMAAAGMSHGGFYRHFTSKDELVAEAVAMGLEQMVLESEHAAGQGARAALEYALQYVSPENRDDIEHSCLFAASGSELVRAAGKTRHVASKAFTRAIRGLAPFMRTRPYEDPTSAAIGVLTQMIGTLTMSRLVDDRALSDRILEITRERLRQSMVVEAHTREEPRGAGAFGNDQRMDDTS